VIRVLLARGREWGYIPADGFRLQAFICSGAHFLGLRIVSAGDSKGELALAHPCRDQPGGGDGDTVVDCCLLLPTDVAEKAIVPETPTPIAALRATRAYTVFASASKDSQLRGRIHRKNRPEETRGYNRSMQENDSDRRRAWDMEEHNRQIAESASVRYQMGEAA